MLCIGELSEPSNYDSRFQRYRIPLTTLHGGVNSLLLQQLLLYVMGLGAGWVGSGRCWGLPSARFDSPASREQSLLFSWCPQLELGKLQRRDLKTRVQKVINHLSRIFQNVLSLRNAFSHGLTPTVNVSLHKNPFVSESKFPWSGHTQGRLHLRMNSFWFFFSTKALIGRRKEGTWEDHLSKRPQKQTLESPRQPVSLHFAWSRSSWGMWPLAHKKSWSQAWLKPAF